MDIKSEILDYINCNETTGALLLTGPWGCGKSFLVKQIAQDLNKEKIAAVTVISLFGLESIAAINKRVKDEYINLDMGSVGKAVNKFSKGFTTLLKDGFSVAATATAAIPSPTTTGLSAASQGLSALMSYDVFSLVEIKNKVGKDDNIQKFVIVFDDLERCGIYSKKDLLGAINEFVENKQIKVIVIADEEKINGEEYREYKEKLVSRTVRMSADYNLLIEQLVTGYSDAAEGYTEFLEESIDLLKQVFFESKTTNVRSLKCILADFERVYAAWKETDIPTDDMKWALYTFGAEMFTAKSPLKNETGESQTNSYSRKKKDPQYQYKGKLGSNFNSLNYWIKSGVWEKERFQDELKRKYILQEDLPKHHFLNYRFWDLQQKDIDVGLPQAVELAYAGELSKDELISLVGKVHLLHSYGITLPVDIDYQKIEDGFEDRFRKIISGTVAEPRSHTFIERNGVDDAADSLFVKIERFDDRIDAAENRKQFVCYLSGDDSISSYSLKGMYIEEFDDELYKQFIRRYAEVDNFIKREYAQVLLGMVFDFDAYSTEENQKHTRDNFEKLKTFLEKIKTEDQITGIVNKSFVEEIRKKFGDKE